MTIKSGCEYARFGCQASNDQFCHLLLLEQYLQRRLEERRMLWLEYEEVVGLRVQVFDDPRPTPTRGYSNEIREI